jgi:hypothetical protein
MRMSFGTCVCAWTASVCDYALPLPSPDRMSCIDEFNQTIIWHMWTQSATQMTPMITLT